MALEEASILASCKESGSSPEYLLTKLYGSGAESRQNTPFGTSTRQVPGKLEADSLLELQAKEQAAPIITLTKQRIELFQQGHREPKGLTF